MFDIISTKFNCKDIHKPFFLYSASTIRCFQFLLEPRLVYAPFNCAPKYNTFISSVSYFDTINQLRCNVFPSLLVGLNDSHLQLPFASSLSTIRHITFNSTSYQCCNSMLNIYLNFPSTSQRSHSIYKPVNSILLLFFTYH